MGCPDGCMHPFVPPTLLVPSQPTAHIVHASFAEVDPVVVPVYPVLQAVQASFEASDLKCPAVHAVHPLVPEILVPP